MIRLAMLTFAIFTVSSSLAMPLHATERENLSLMQMISPWRYPDAQGQGAQMSDAATIDVNGARTTQSIVGKTVMTTDASIDKVIEFYKAKLDPTSSENNKDGIEVDPSGRSVIFSDDSKGRPFAMHTIFINTRNMSTVLVITRGKDETKTHISWKQYRRLD
ncbi:hypothetical protein [Allorhodopirellula heiligendammensis]|uniref:Lipocalin-like domain-containing protein n=1 Tax=Allorhodopirellula heiligendammensis TaxID=2714739 RepID=A0A5C6BYI9_9BACT|nr:hypothetical protein [Allorhodopirellula heiligendammensis]TWU16958.1 hypothetical protein Poly21_41670 [Allorhodopirellula heiligendammensis]